MKSDNKNLKPELIITREFDASKEMVFNAFANAEALAAWWGPPGVPITVIKLDFKPDGVFHYKAEMQGQTAWGRFVYKQIKKPDLLEFISSFSDERGGITRAPFSDKFPLEIFNRMELTEQNGKTTIALKGYPVNATEEEIQFFIQVTAGMQQGFAGTFNQLENYLSKFNR
ncbi:MAG: SRPBCC family protein [Bacteroidia bacterium]